MVVHPACALVAGPLGLPYSHAVSRLEDLRELVNASPDDPFPRYALAMHLRDSGMLTEAMAAFRELLVRFPDYVPTYLMAGQCALSLGDREEAARIFRAGVEACGKQGDKHAAQRCAEALALLEK